MLRDRFSRGLDPRALRLADSTREDRVLLGFDLWGSVVHAEMLGATGILPKRSAARIVRGLRSIARDAARGRFPLDARLEDVHLNVERELTRRIGRDGERLHTARSRNDQVATDLALYERAALLALAGAAAAVAHSLLDAARRPQGARTVPGWTHLQPAQRLRWAHLLGTHAFRFARDAERFEALARATELCPLGSGAIAGTSLPIDRDRTAKALAFRRPTPSSVEGVSDRDVALRLLFEVSLTLNHASQFAEELVLGAMPEVGRVRLSDGFVTTSSLMPHKRNPDLAELVRAEAAPAIGRLTSALALSKALPLGYQRDLQAGKPILFEAVDRALLVLQVLAPMAGTTQFLSPPVGPGSTASVELADALVARGVPFRSAHARVARLVRRLERAGRALDDLGPSGIVSEFPELSGRGFRLPGPDEEPELRRSRGGSSRREVDRLLREVAARLRSVTGSVGREERRLELARERAGIPRGLTRLGAPSAGA